jgi:general stress protein 26
MLKIFNASPGFGVQLNEQEIKDFLNESVLNVHLGTIDDRGHPNVHPAWYYYNTSNGKLYVETSKYSKKTDNLRKNKNIYFCIDDPTPPYKGVRGKGTVTIHEDIGFNLPIAEKVLIRYLGTLEHPMSKSLIEAQKGGLSVMLEITPQYFSTWDYSRQG